MSEKEEAARLYQYFVGKVREGFVADRVKDGKFQAMMEVALVNDGPVSTNSRKALSVSLFPGPMRAAERGWMGIQGRL